MQTECAQFMETASELLDYGLLREGAEKLVALRGCSCKAGCDHWQTCISLVERRWQTSATPKQRKQTIAFR